MENLAERYEVRLEDICEQLQIGDGNIQLRAAETARKMLVEENALEPSITNHLINGGIVPILVRILESDKYVEYFSIQPFTILKKIISKIVKRFALTNPIAVINVGCISSLIRLLDSANDSVVLSSLVTAVNILCKSGSQVKFFNS